MKSVDRRNGSSPASAEVTDGSAATGSQSRAKKSAKQTKSSPVHKFYQQWSSRAPADDRLDAQSSEAQLIQFGRLVASDASSIANSKVERAKGALGLSEAQAGKTFETFADRGRAAVRAIREAPNRSFGGQLQIGIDALAEIEPFEPMLGLAMRLAKSPTTGGSDVLARTVERLHLPDDIRSGIETQLTTLPRVASEIPDAPEGREVAPFNVADFCLSGTDGAVVPGWRNADLTGRLDALDAALPQTIDAFDAATCVAMLQNILDTHTTNRELKAKCFEHAWRKMDGLLRKAPSDESPAPSLSDLITAHCPDDQFKTIFAEAAELCPSLRRDLCKKAPLEVSGIAAASRKERQEHLLPTMLDSLAAQDLSADVLGGMVAYLALQFEDDKRVHTALDLYMNGDESRLDALLENHPALLLRWPENLQSPQNARFENLGLPEIENPVLTELLEQRAPIDQLVRFLASDEFLSVPGASGAASGSRNEQQMIFALNAGRGLDSIATPTLALRGTASFQDSLRTTLKDSRLIDLVPMKVREGISSPEDAAKVLSAAFVQWAQGENPGHIPFGNLCRAFGRALVAADNGDAIARSVLDSVHKQPGGVAWTALRIVHDSGVLDAQEMAAHYQKHLAYEAVEFLPYAALPAKENLERLLETPIENFLRAIQDVEIPSDGLERRLRSSLSEDVHGSPAEFRLLQLAVDERASAEVVATFALRLVENTAWPRENAEAIFQKMAAAGYGESFGKTFVEQLLALDEGTQAVLLPELVRPISEFGDRLFAAQELASLGASPHCDVALDWLCSPPMDFDKVQLGALFVRGFQQFQAPPVSFADSAKFTEMALGLKKAGAKIEFPEEVFVQMVRANAAVPSAEPNFGTAIRQGAKLAGIPTKDVLSRVLPESGETEAWGPESDSAAGVFRLLARAPKPDVAFFQEFFANWQEAAATPLPVIPIVEFLTRDDVDPQLLNACLEPLLQVAGEHGEFSCYQAIDETLSHGDPAGSKRALLTDALRNIVEADPSGGWASTTIGMRARVESLVAKCEDAFKRAVGTDAGKSAAALEEIAQLAVDGGTDTHFLIDSALDGLQAHARATRPTLRELDQVHDLRSAGGSRTAQRSHTGPTKNLWGVECPLFEQLTQAADVPPEKYTDTSLATFQVNVSKLVAGLFGRDSGPVIALGDPGCGKTRVPEWLATELGYPYGRFQALPDADRNDFLGTWRLKTGGPAFDKHEFIRLWQEGGIILIDEFNHFDEDMQRFIAEFVRNYHKEGFELTIGNERVKVQRNPQTRIVFTGNFDSPECNDIEDELASHCNIAWFAPMTGEDLTTLLQNWLPTYDPELVSLAGTFHADVVAKSINRELRGNHSLSIRNVEKLKERVTLYTDQDPNFAIARAVREVYLDHVDHPDDRAKLEEAFEAVFQIAPNDTIPDDSFYTLEVGDSAIRFGDVTFPVGPGGAKSIEGMTLDVGGIEDWPILADLDLKKAVYAILKAWSVNETPHLVGPDESDKNIAIRVAAEMTGWTPVEKGFNSQTQLPELLSTTTLRVDPSTGQNVTADVDGSITARVRSEAGAECILLMRNFDDALPSLQGGLHEVFERDRAFRLPSGEMVNMSPQFHAATTSKVAPGDAHKLTSAMDNRLSTYRMAPVSEEKAVARLEHAASSWLKGDLGASVARGIARFQSIYLKMLEDNRICATIDNGNLNRASLERMMKVLNGVRISMEDGGDVQEAFIREIGERYDVPNFDGSADRLAAVAEALAHGDEDALREYEG